MLARCYHSPVTAALALRLRAGAAPAGVWSRLGLGAPSGDGDSGGAAGQWPGRLATWRSGAGGGPIPFPDPAQEAKQEERESL